MADPSSTRARREAGGAGVGVGASLLLVYLTSIIVLTPNYLMTPAFPAMADALSLTSADIAMLMTVYMVPAAIASVPAGVLADRFGRKLLIVGAVAVIGLGGIVIFLWPTYTVMLVVRVFQGAAYGSIQTTTITIIGDLRRGREQAAAQGMRSVVLAAGGALLPAIGGFLVLAHWRVGFAVQGLCLVVAVLLYLRLPESGRHAQQARRDRAAQDAAGTGDGPKPLRQALGEPLVLLLAGSGLLRFSLKYAFMTFVPILYATYHGDNSVAIGLLIGTSSFLGMVGALSVRRLLGVFRPSSMLVASTIATGVGLLMLGGARFYPLLVAGALLYGLTDSMSSVCQNALITVSVDDEARGTAVSIAALGRNSGKFLGPALVGPLSVVVALSSVFAGFGALAIVVAFFLRPVARLDHHLKDPASP